MKMPRGPDYQKDRSDRQKARIMDALADGPMNTKALAEKLHLSRTIILKYLHQLGQEPRLVRVSGYDDRHGRPAPIYALGSEADEVFVRQADRPRPGRVAMRRQQIIDALTGSPMTCEQLSNIIGIQRSPIRNYLAELRNERRVHISGWTKAIKQGDIAPIYGLGNRPDAPKPRKSRQQRWKEEKADPERYDRIKAKKRAAYAVDVAVKKPQGIFAALGL